MFEHKKAPLLPFSVFLNRVFYSLFVAGIITAFSLGIGVGGYHYLCDLEWIDALLNASMILTGMGPVNPMMTPGAKVFASLYALFSGIVLITVSGLLLAPPLHRLLHIFHLDEEDEG